MQQRKGIDHIGVSVVYFCHDGNGRFLMAKRGSNARDEHGRWDIGGGGLEHGETVEERLRQEIKEEYCTEVLEHEFLGYDDVHREHNGDETHWLALFFKVRVDPKQVENGEPHKFDEVAWFELDDLPSEEELHSQLPEFFRRYRGKLNSIFL